MNKVGLTGNIGSGKSTVAKIFSSLGVPIFYADKEAKKILNQIEIITQLETHFNKNLIKQNGKVDRQTIASIVFKDKDALAYLNHLIHPRVSDYFAKWVEAHKEAPYVIHEAAILFESGLNKFMDSVIYIKADKDLRINRIIERDGLQKTAIIERMQNQWDDQKKIPLADFVIMNRLNEMLIPQVLELHSQLMQ